MFQYRKRYGLHAITACCALLQLTYVSIPQAVWIACNITLLLTLEQAEVVSIPQAVWIACNYKHIIFSVGNMEFQYRKRYGLHAMINPPASLTFETSFNTASGMDCMQSGGNTVFNKTAALFQYRKRYGLHAILSPRTLENSEPKRWFSNTPSLFALFPKPQGIFLSQKAVQKGCEARYTKETFVHEKNLKLMAVFRKS